MFVVGVLVFAGAPFANKYLWHISIVDKICKFGLLSTIIAFILIIGFSMLRYGGIRKIQLLNSIENNLISVGAYIKNDNVNYAELPKIKIRKNKIVISLKNLRIRNIIERYLDSFSTALPERYIVEDYYISQNNAEVIIEYEDIKTYKPEVFTLSDYREKIEGMDILDLYFDMEMEVMNV